MFLLKFPSLLLSLPPAQLFFLLLAIPVLNVIAPVSFSVFFSLHLSHRTDFANVLEQRCVFTMPCGLSVIGSFLELLDNSLDWVPKVFHFAFEDSKVLEVFDL